MNQSISQTLHQARLNRNLSLEEASKATRIRQPFLEAMEAGEFNALPSAVQTRGFLRTYAEYLGLDPVPLLQALGYRVQPATDSPFQAAMHVPYEETKTSPIPSRGHTRPQSREEDGTILPGRAIVNVPIFKDIGHQLFAQRQSLGLSLEEVENQTLIRKHYLQALEQGDFARMPSPVQGRGMLKNYCTYLGLDQDKLLLQFAEGIQQSFRMRQPEHSSASLPAADEIPQPLPPARRGGRAFSTDLLWGLLLICMLVGFIGWGVMTIFNAREAEVPQPSPPSIADVLLATQTITPSPTQPTPTLTSEAIFYPTVVASMPAEEGGAEPVETPGEGTPGAGEAPPDSNPGKVHLNIVVRQRAWLRVTVDGKVQYEGRAQAGSAFPFSANERIELVTGNAGGLEIYYNQQNLGVLGYQNEVINRIYTAQGALNPTPTITLTPTITQTPTATRRPTLTSAVTDTPAAP